MSNIISQPKSKYIEPYYIPELAEDGLTAHDIAASIRSPVRDVLKKLRLGKWITKRSLEPSDGKVPVFIVVPYTTTIDSDTYAPKRVDSFALNTAAAKAFVARWVSEEGDGYLRFLFECERKVTEEIPRLQSLVSKLQASIESQWKRATKGLPRGRQRGQVTIPVERDTLFGKETVWVEALREQASALQLLLAERSHIIKVNRGLHRRLAEIEARLEAPDKPEPKRRQKSGRVIKMLPKSG